MILLWRVYRAGGQLLSLQTLGKVEGTSINGDVAPSIVKQEVDILHGEKMRGKDTNQEEILANESKNRIQGPTGEMEIH